MSSGPVLTAEAPVAQLAFDQLHVVKPTIGAYDFTFEGGTLIQMQDAHGLSPDEYGVYRALLGGNLGLKKSSFDPQKNTDVIAKMKEQAAALGISEEDMCQLQGISKLMVQSVAEQQQRWANRFTALVGGLDRPFWLVGSTNPIRYPTHAAPLFGATVIDTATTPRVMPIVSGKNGEHGRFPDNLKLVPFPLHLMFPKPLQ